MSRFNSKFVVIVFSVFAGITLLSACVSPKGETSIKPNLLFIMTDQQRYDALSIAGNTVVETPNLDRLAKQGHTLKMLIHHVLFVHRHEHPFLQVIL